MTDRSYLSIGEVLSLLTAEFPDVTISKIRFLESQGLIDPERTPSGYRKFYETDVERLKWILRQQRENFLPLKVIRGRLGDDGEAPRDEDEAEAASMQAHPTNLEPSQPETPVRIGAPQLQTVDESPHRLPRSGGRRSPPHRPPSRRCGPCPVRSPQQWSKPTRVTTRSR